MRSPWFVSVLAITLVPASGCIRKGCEGATGVTCDLGSSYLDLGVIDPDDPSFEDGDWAEEDVRDAFADARDHDSKTYRAYRAAREHAGLLECAFCSCGCAASDGHLSALDCFKDMHGFT